MVESCTGKCLFFTEDTCMRSKQSVVFINQARMYTVSNQGQVDFKLIYLSIRTYTAVCTDSGKLDIYKNAHMCIRSEFQINIRQWFILKI